MVSTIFLKRWPYIQTHRHTKPMLYNLFQAVGHSKNFPVANGCTGRLSRQRPWDRWELAVWLYFKYTAVMTWVSKGKGKAYLYSAFRETWTQGAQVWITQGCPCKLHHTCLYLANVRQMAPLEWQTSDSPRYSFIDMTQGSKGNTEQSWH